MHKRLRQRRLQARLRPALVSLLAAGLLFTGPGCGGPTVQPWHSEKLTSEFTTDKADEIRTFDDYQRLEEDLFRELDEKVYSQVETGPEYRLARYSAGSDSDPRGRTPDWNRSFDWPAENTVGGVLLLHGLTDAPYTFRALGKALNQRGYRVLGLRLPGHGTAPSGLTSLRWQDMAASVRLAARHLAAEVGDKPVHVIGYSTGAALAVDFALTALEGGATPVPASLVLISPAIGLHPAAAFAGFKTGLAAFPGLGGLAWLQIAPEFDPYKYNSFATNAGAQVHRLTQSVARRLRERSDSEPDTVLPPILVFKSTVDATVSTDAVVDRLLTLLVPERHELVLFDINRVAVKSRLMISDPGPLTDRLMTDPALPFAVTFVTNESEESTSVIARRKLPHSAEIASTEPLNLSWPPGVISLSHVALPFAPDDPLYGQGPPESEEILFLGQMALLGERGLLQFPSDWLLRLRFNPFYDYLEARTIEWIDKTAR